MRPKLFHRWPLWAQLTGALLAAVILFRVISFLAISEFTEKAVLEVYTEDAQNIVSMIDAALVEDARGNPSMERGFFEPRFEKIGSGFYWAVRFESGMALYSPSFGNKVRPLMPTNNSKGKTEIELMIAPGLQVHKSFPARGKLPAYTIAVAMSTAQVNARIERINVRRAVVNVIALLGLIALGGAILWWTSRPLRHVSREIDEVAVGARNALSDNYPSDVQNLVDKFNEIIKNQRQAFDHTALVLASFNHNIRSGLAKILYQIDRSENTGESVNVESISDQIVSIQKHLVSYTNSFRSPGLQFLMLKPPVMDVETELENVFATGQRVHLHKNLDWYLGVGPAVAMPCDARSFRSILFNLLDNAGKWATHRVACTWVLKDGQLLVVVEDDGPGLGALADGRSEAGMGVGLQMAHELAAMLGGVIDSGTSRLGGARFCLSIPVPS